MLKERFVENVRACFTGIWLRSHEHEDAQRDIAQCCQEQGWLLSTWDIDRGLRCAEQPSGSESVVGDPVTALRAWSEMDMQNRVSIIVLPNFHRMMNSAEVVQLVTHLVERGKVQQLFVVILSSVVELPHELEKLFVCLNHELPDREQLLEIASGIATEAGELPEGNELERILDAASGLTRFEAEGAFSLSLIRHGRLRAPDIWELKSQLLIKSGLLTLHRGSEDFTGIGGLGSLKSFCRRALRHRTRQSNQPQARGVLLLGIPGTGKSAFCQALGNETGRPTLTLDVGALMGSLVGQTEERTRRALRIVDAMQPAVLFIDEIEKALSGVGGSGSSDGGVSTRMLGALLSWLNDRTSDVFVVCTANDISRLPPELCRAERFDGVFFLDLPASSQREAIWELYLHRFGLDAEQARPDNEDWTGAEIRACCRLAALLDLPLVQAAQNIVPIAAVSRESVERLRNWANGRCLSADAAGIYQYQAANAPRRRLPKDPSVN